MAILSAIITDIGLQKVIEAESNKGWFIYPTHFSISETAGSFEKSRIDINPTWITKQISSASAIYPHTVEFTCELLPNDLDSNYYVGEVYILAEDKLGVQFLFAIVQSSGVIAYDHESALKLRVMISIDNSDLASVIQLNYTQAGEIRDHNVDLNAHPHLQKVISTGGFFTQPSEYTFVGQDRIDDAITIGSHLQIVKIVSQTSQSLALASDIHEPAKAVGIVHKYIGTNEWLPNHNYEVGERIVPTTRNQHAYTCIVAGQSVEVEPTFPTLTGGTVSEGFTTAEEMIPDMSEGEWTLGTGWSIIVGELIKQPDIEASTATPSGVFTVTVGRRYRVVIVCTEVTGTVTYTLGGVTGTAITSTTITDEIIASTGGKIVFTASAEATATITSISVLEMTQGITNLTWSEETHATIISKGFVYWDIELPSVAPGLIYLSESVGGTITSTQTPYLIGKYLDNNLFYFDFNRLSDYDQYLDYGGANQVSAADMKVLNNNLHLRLHNINSASDHTGVSGVVPGNLAMFNASGYLVDAGVSMLVSIGTGTTNKIPKFLTATSIGDSIITDDGSTVTVAGDLTANKVYNAVWNDIADFIELDESIEIEYGRVYVKSLDGVRKSVHYAELGALGIASDTYGYGLGIKNKPGYELPIAIAGFVLAYVDKEYPCGTPLTCSYDGMLTEAQIETKINEPHLILATYYKNEFREVYGDEHSIIVNKRHWVKVK